MKKYTDQGKVDTRSGFGAGRLGWRVLLLSVLFVFVLMPAVCSCSVFLNGRNMFVVEYRKDDGEPRVVKFPTSGVVGIAKISNPDWFYDKPVFYKGPFQDIGVPQQGDDSLARFHMRLEGSGIGLEFNLKSDTTFFYEGQSYYLSCDNDGIPNSLDYLNVGFPGVSRDSLIRDMSWARFLPKDNNDISFSVEFEYVFRKKDGHAKVTGCADVYSDVHIESLEPISDWIK